MQMTFFVVMQLLWDAKNGEHLYCLWDTVGYQVQLYEESVHHFWWLSFL